MVRLSHVDVVETEKAAPIRGRRKYWTYFYDFNSSLARDVSFAVSHLRIRRVRIVHIIEHHNSRSRGSERLPHRSHCRQVFFGSIQQDEEHNIWLPCKRI